MDRPERTLSEELAITANLALLDLSDSDRADLETAVQTLLDYFQVMSRIDVSELPPTTHTLFEENRVRADVERDSNTNVDTHMPDDLLEQAPDLEERFIAIPNVL